MKFKFITMTLMICLALTIGVIAVQNSNYPSPFIKNGDSDVAIVVGEDAASSDFLSAINLAQNLQAELIKQTGIKEDSFVITSGSEYLKLEKPSNKFNLGETMLEVWPISLTETDLPFLLGKGTYEDSSGRDYDYNQKIALNDLPLTHFSDSDYEDGEPTIGFRLSSGVNILNYTLDFIKNPLYNEDELEKTKIKILGKEYEIAYVDTTEDKIILFDSNNSQIINEDESVSITLNKETYKVSVLFMNEDIVKLDVNGISTNKLKEGDVYKIKEDVYVNVQEILYSSAENGKRLVEITLGSQK